MKTRIGFVSNSSSSSFLIYGAYLSESKAEEIIAKLLPDDEEKEFSYSDRTSDSLKKITGMDVHNPVDGYSYYIGESWDCIGDYETGAQFKARIEEKLKETLGPDIKCGTHSEAWYDG
jgi:hypothetical protein